ncbi:transmembrane sensor [Pedobacter africanus]|uniref:Ferric-dicitrate binding protein FerR (Iron transport regulator) n=1 Tax=Pedobacter africanus TaxID=151894 RepID=A0ACC6KYT0_9SPHI|nr:FecR domain-containing protein [Pedobacter africanus]MDR6784422.1 ferric-dicitrate binding protein FerR (iron transport regulator) [Pedobacter africanus]
MENSKAKDLLKRYSEGKCSPEEAALVETYYNQFNARAGSELTGETLEKNLDLVWDNLSTRHKRNNHKLWYGLAAAVALITVSAGLFFALQLQHTKKPSAVLLADLNSIAPGTANAVLTLADGSKISLDSASRGRIAMQGDVALSRGADNKLVYTHGGDVSNPSMLNTIETPKKAEFQLNLPDGTKVWLNASSSLSYPVAFSGKERSVILTGEAYFEVAHNKTMPFKVRTGTQELEVLGTHFNVNAYGEGRGIRTTLLEGSVRLKQIGSTDTKLLKPGQMAVLRGETFEVGPADTESEIAWKTGYFIFNEEEIQFVMQKISRWYDVNVTYSPGLLEKKLKFGGIVSRNRNLAVVLKTMERTGKVRFRLEGEKNIVVLPNN